MGDLITWQFVYPGRSPERLPASGPTFVLPIFLQVLTRLISVIVSILPLSEHIQISPQVKICQHHFALSQASTTTLTMKENYTALYPNEQVSQAVGDYSHAHSTKLPQHITDHHVWGSTQEKSNYMISPFQAQFQVWMARAVGAKRSKFISFSCFLCHCISYHTRDQSNLLFYVRLNANFYCSSRDRRLHRLLNNGMG